MACFEFLGSYCTYSTFVSQSQITRIILITPPVAFNFGTLIRAPYSAEVEAFKSLIFSVFVT